MSSSQYRSRDGNVTLGALGRYTFEMDEEFTAMYPSPREAALAEPGFRFVADRPEMQRTGRGGVPKADQRDAFGNC